jgi:hypothetical protein
MPKEKKAFKKSPSAFLVAVDNLDYKKVKSMLDENHARIGDVDDRGWTALHYLASHFDQLGRGVLKLLKLLIDRGADRRARDKSGRLPFDVKTNGWEVEPELLLLHPTHLPQLLNDNPIYLIWACGESVSFELFEKILGLMNKENINRSYRDDGKTVLHQAAWHVTSARKIKALIDAGASITQKAKNGSVPADCFPWDERESSAAYLLLLTPEQRREHSFKPAIKQVNRYFSSAYKELSLAARKQAEATPLIPPYQTDGSHLFQQLDFKQATRMDCSGRRNFVGLAAVNDTWVFPPINLGEQPVVLVARRSPSRIVGVEEDAVVNLVAEVDFATQFYFTLFTPSGGLLVLDEKPLGVLSHESLERVVKKLSYEQPLVTTNRAGFFVINAANDEPSTTTASPEIS